jgi:hypothetical protein
MTRGILCPLAAFAATFATACSDRPGPVGPSAPSAQVLTCLADLRSHTLTCAASGAASGASKVSADLVLGGQGIYVALRSGNVSYNSGTEIFQADVTMQNLTALPLSGVKVFFCSGPSVVSGSGR